MSLTGEILNKNYNSFFSDNTLQDDAVIVVAFSGGTDSVALALSLKDYFPGKKIILAHLSHGIRSVDSQKFEDDFVRDFAQDGGFTLTERVLPHGEVSAMATQKGLSLEEAARLRRYEFFGSLLDQHPRGWIFLGHHLDDQTETQVMRFFQGSGPGGLKGIAPRRNRFLRPLLKTPKSLLAQFLKEKGVDHLDDESNLDDKFLRNRIRNELMPLVNDIFPGYQGALGKLSDKMNALQEFLEEKSDEVLVWDIGLDGSFSIDLEPFLSAPDLLRRESLYKLANFTLKNEKRIPYGFFTLINTCRITQGTVFLRGFGYRLIHRGGRVFWERDVVFPSKNSYLMSIIKDVDKLLGGIELNIRKGQDGRGQGERSLSFKCDSPLVMRSRRIGDRISLPGGSKSLKKLYNQWKVPEELRWQLPVFEDSQGILGVMGEPWGFSNKICNRRSGDIWSITWSKEIIGG